MAHAEHVNATVANMSSKELVSEILKLKDANEFTLKRIENYQQQLYEMKRELSTANAMEAHLSSEIELLQNTDKCDARKLAKKLEALEEQVHVLKQTNQANVELYECQLHEKQLKQQALAETLRTRETAVRKVDEGRMKQCTDDISTLESKVAELTPLVTESEARCSEIRQLNESSEHKINEMSGVLAELKECLSSKRQASAAGDQLLQRLQDERVLLQLAVDTARRVPSEKAAKGNSLFAEVDDNRVKLEKHVQVVTAKYAAMQLKYANKAQELQKLHADYEALTRSTGEEAPEDQSGLIEAYTEDSGRLVECITQLETDLEALNATDNKQLTRAMKCAEEMVFITRKKLLELLRELRADSGARVDCERALYAARQELMQCQTETVQLRIAGLMREQTMEELRLRQSSVSPCNSLPASPGREGGCDKLATVKGEVDASQAGNKENQGGRNVAGKVKRVNFSEATVDPKTTDRSRRRVLTVPCVHIPSIKRQP